MGYIHGDQTGELAVTLNHDDPYAVVRIKGVGIFKIANPYRLEGAAGSAAYAIHFMGKGLILGEVAKHATDFRIDTQVVMEDCS